ncbi:transposase [Streptomyces ambofaciens]
MTSANCPAAAGTSAKSASRLGRAPGLSRWRQLAERDAESVRTGCAWRQLPKDFAPWPTLYWYFLWWHDDGTGEGVHDALRNQVERRGPRRARSRDHSLAGLAFHCLSVVMKSLSRGPV